MKAPTAKEITLAAASVRGARSAGVETPAAKAAPALLDAAERALEQLLEKIDGAEPSAPSMTAEREYSRLVGVAVAYAAAVEELRAALRGEEIAA